MTMGTVLCVTFLVTQRTVPIVIPSPLSFSVFFCRLFDSYDLFGEFFLAVDVALALDHDALCLRGAGAVQ